MKLKEQAEQFDDVSQPPDRPASPPARPPPPSASATQADAAPTASPLAALGALPSLSLLQQLPTTVGEGLREETAGLTQLAAEQATQAKEAIAGGLQQLGQAAADTRQEAQRLAGELANELTDQAQQAKQAVQTAIGSLGGSLLSGQTNPQEPPAESAATEQPAPESPSKSAAPDTTPAAMEQLAQEIVSRFRTPLIVFPKSSEVAAVLRLFRCLPGAVRCWLCLLFAAGWPLNCLVFGLDGDAG